MIVRKILKSYLVNIVILYKIAYGRGFKDCLLGNKKVSEYIECLSSYKEFEDIKSNI